MRAGADVLANHEVLKEGLDQLRPVVGERPITTEQQEATDPLLVALLGAVGIAAAADFGGESDQEVVVGGPYGVERPIAAALFDVTQFLGGELPRDGGVFHLQLPGRIFPVLPIDLMPG